MTAPSSEVPSLPHLNSTDEQSCFLKPSNASHLLVSSWYGSRVRTSPYLVSFPNRGSAYQQSLRGSYLSSTSPLIVSSSCICSPETNAHHQEERTERHRQTYLYYNRLPAVAQDTFRTGLVLHPAFLGMFVQLPSYVTCIPLHPDFWFLPPL
jgi:hypothetical protein